GNECQQQAEPANLDRLRHQIDTVQVAFKDRAADEGAARGPGVIENGAELGDLGEVLHAPEGHVVQRLEHAESGEQELPGSTGRVEDGQLAQGLPERAGQGGIATAEQIDRELDKVDIACQEIVDRQQSLATQPAVEGAAAVTAGEVLAP